MPERLIDANKLLKMRFSKGFNDDGELLVPVREVIKAIRLAPTVDAVSVRHGRWHIMSEDPYDESECPTEEGWYRIITTDGEEMTDYYFAKPTLIGYGVVFWKNCKKGIRAWAKMDGKDDGE